LILKETWLKICDSSQAQWIKTFHLYGGFSRKVSRSGFFIKGSVRVLQPTVDYYKGFSVRFINKGKILRGLISKQTYTYLNSTGSASRASLNSSVVMKKKFILASERVIGVGFRLIKKKRFLAVFKSII
jgi:ribosomal protein L14